MKRQISLIITIMVLACSRGFVAAQSSTKTTSWKSYVTSRSKPITLTQRVNSKPSWSTDNLTTYRSPLSALNNGDILMEQYLTQVLRDLDIMHSVVWEYRQALIKTQSVVSIGWTTSACQGITDLDIVSLMSMSRIFQTRMSNYPVITIEPFTSSSLDQSCIKRASCVWWSINQQVASRTAWQDKRPLCSDQVATRFFTIYDQQLRKSNFDIITQYNNIFVNNSLKDSPFDIIVDMQELVLLQATEAVEYIKWTELLTGATQWSQGFTLPNELIASTQQLLTALDLDTTIDPRQDDQIAALISQATLVSNSSATIPTGSVLNACVDPAATTTSVQSLLQQLQTTQQATQEYNVSLNTNQTLNNVINGSLNASDLAPQITKLSSVDVPTRTTSPIVPVADLSSNPLWAQLAQIQDADLWSIWWGWAKLTGDVSWVLGAWGSNTGADGLKQCVKWCYQQYDPRWDSQCIDACKAQWSIGGWLLDVRACNQQCYNARIACAADCLCNSTSQVAQKQVWTGQVSKIYDSFEARRCVIPTNKLRNPQWSSCSRVDPITGMPQTPSAECLIDNVVEQWENNRESGRWGIRINPKERFQLPNKFDLKTMIRFPVTVINSPIRNDQDKKKDIKTSQNKQEFSQTIILSPLLSNTQVAGDSYELIQEFINGQIDLRQKLQLFAETTQQIVSQP